MNCSHCGAPVEPGNRFCLSCGQPISPEPASMVPKKRNIPALVMSGVSFVLAVLLVLSLTGVFGGGVAVSTASGGSKSFSTPEDAIAYFVDRMAAGDWAGALAACAINEIAENYDYETMARDMDALYPDMYYLPSEYSQFVEYNRSILQASLLKEMAWMSFSVNLPEEYENFIRLNPVSEGIAFDQVVEDLNPAFTHELKILRIDTLEMDDSFYESSQDNAKIMGAEAYNTRVVLYRYNGGYYAGGFTFLKYNGRWKVWYPSTTARTGLPIYGALVEVADEDEYEDMLG